MNAKASAMAHSANRVCSNRAQLGLTREGAGHGVWIRAMLTHSARLKYKDIQAISLCQSSQRCDTTL
jgi:hypothetical protein